MFCNQPVERLPLVTIGLLTYNNQDTIIKALESLIHQRYHNKEIIIFDDCSNDKTIKICETYIQKFSFIKFHKNPINLGVFKNFNQLSAHINGKYFLWACPDDWYHPNFLSEHVKVLEKNSTIAAILSTFQIKYVNGFKIKTQECVFEEIILDVFLSNFNTTIEKILYMSNGSQYCCFFHSLVRSDVFKKIFPQSPYFFSIEELYSIILIFFGGISTIDKVLFVKYQDLTPLEIRNPEAYKIAYGVCNKVMCLYHFFKFIIKSDFPSYLKFKLLTVLWLAFKRHLIRVIFQKMIGCIITIKHQYFPK